MQLADSIEKGIKKVLDCSIVKVPIADGGEGTLDVFSKMLNVQTIPVSVLNPLNQEIEAMVGQLDEKTFIVEMAMASGLTLLTQDELNPYKTSTYGTGQLIKKCLDKGAETIYIGIGGSATNDAGIGCLEALGMRFYNEQHQLLKQVNGESLCSIQDFDDHTFDKRIKDVEFIILSDVNNPLVGKQGASAIFGPQKGLLLEGVNQLDQAMNDFSKLVKRKTHSDTAMCQGAGAAGGLGYALLTFFNGKFKNGVNEILSLIHFESLIQNADLIITGEGRVDQQSLSKKAIMGVLHFAQQQDIPVAILAGSVSEDVSVFYDAGFSFIKSIKEPSMALSYAMQHVDQLVEKAAAELITSVINQ